MGDGEVWNRTAFDIEVYPGLSVDTDGAQKPSIQSAALMRSLFMNLRTALTLNLYDYTTNPNAPTVIGSAYMTGRIIPLHGAVKDALALRLVTGLGEHLVVERLQLGWLGLHVVAQRVQAFEIGPGDVLRVRIERGEVGWIAHRAV